MKYCNVRAFQSINRKYYYAKQNYIKWLVRRTYFKFGKN